MIALSNYIAESIKVEDKPGSSNYKIVTLYEREVDCSKLTEDDFVSMMTEDVKAACDAYNEYVKKDREESKQAYINRMVANARKFAESKWKTEKRRQLHLDDAIAKANAEVASKHWNKGIDSFDFKPDERENSIPEVCIIRPEKMDETKLRKCFNELCAGPYFKKALGWKFKYEASKNGWGYAFRPYIDMILDESTAAEREADKEHLADSIARFYSNSNYWGD